jgi:hypothetical protein
MALQKEPLVLPTEPVKALSQNPRRLIIYSQPKMGKTTFASQLPGNLIIDLEHGAELIDAMKVKADNLQQLQEIVDAIVKAGKPYKYITVDTITKLEDWCEWEATRDYMASALGRNFNRDRSGNALPESSWESVLSLPNGAGYLWLRLCYKRWIEKLVSLATHVILIAHLKDKMLEKAGKEVSAKDLDLTGKIKSITCAGADAIGYLYRSKEEGVSKLRLSFVSSEEVLCGARPPHLKGQDIPAEWSKIFTDG